MFNNKQCECSPVNFNTSRTVFSNKVACKSDTVQFWSCRPLKLACLIWGKFIYMKENCIFWLWNLDCCLTTIHNYGITY